MFLRVVFCLVMLVINVYSQMSVSCSNRIEYEIATKLNDENELEYVFNEDGNCIFTQVFKDENAGCLFEFKNNYSMFTHITTHMTSNYYLTGSSKYDPDVNRNDIKVTSDVGNTYTYTFDLNNSVVFIRYVKDNACYQIEFKVKSYFNNQN